MSHIYSVVAIVLKEKEVQQELILLTYLELVKLQSMDISKEILNHLRQIMMNIHNEAAIAEIFKITQIVLEMKSTTELKKEVYELEEMLIKEALFEVKYKVSLCNLTS